MSENKFLNKPPPPHTYTPLLATGKDGFLPSPLLHPMRCTIGPLIEPLYDDDQGLKD